MEIRRWLYYVAVNCVLVCCIVAKPFSLNKLIEAESDQKEVVHTTISPKLEEPEPVAERFSLNKGLKPLNQISKKFKKTGSSLNFVPLSKKISPLQYRKTFQIKSPLKPKRVKLSLRTRHKRKNQSVKREIDSNVKLNQKYVPLLRSLGMLFDNILGTDSGESFEITKHKKRLRYNPEDDDVPCKCPRQESNAEFESEAETVTSTEALTSEVSVTTEAAPEATDYTPAGNIRSFRWNKNVPLLLPRNTIGSRRNNYGFSEGSHAAHNWSAERYISRDNGDSEHDPAWGQDVSDPEGDEEHTDSYTRNNASSVRRTNGAIRGRESGNNTKEVYENDAISKDEAENLLDGKGEITEYNGQDKLETRRDEAKSAELLPEPVRKQRGFVSEDKVGHSTEPIQSKEDNEESNVSIAFHSSDDQRIFDRDGTHSTEDQKADARHETVTLKSPEIQIPQYFLTKSSKTSKTKGPVVVIIDGYSVTRHRNGENKLAEKAIHIRP